MVRAQNNKHKLQTGEWPHCEMVGMSSTLAQQHNMPERCKPRPANQSTTPLAPLQLQFLSNSLLPCVLYAVVAACCDEMFQLLSSPAGGAAAAALPAACCCCTSCDRRRLARVMESCLHSGQGCTKQGRVRPVATAAEWTGSLGPDSPRNLVGALISVGNHKGPNV